MPWEYYNDMSKEINEFFLDVYSKPSKEIDNVYVSEKLLIFDRSHPSKLDLEPETYELSLPEEFWYRLVPSYKDFLSSLEDLDTLWEMVDKKFYSIAENIFTFDYPWSMTSGSRSYALWDFGGDRVFLGTIPDVTPPTIYCAIEKKNQRDAKNILKQMYVYELIKVFGTSSCLIKNMGSSKIYDIGNNIGGYKIIRINSDSIISGVSNDICPNFPFLKSCIKTSDALCKFTRPFD